MILHWINPFPRINTDRLSQKLKAKQVDTKADKEHREKMRKLVRKGKKA